MDWLVNKHLISRETLERNSFLHFLYLSFLFAGNLEILIPFVLGEITQPTTEKLTPGILF